MFNYKFCEMIVDYFQIYWNTIFETYLGDKIINTPERKIGHVKWAIKEANEVLKREEINLQINPRLLDWLLNCTNHFYYEKDKDKVSKSDIHKRFRELLLQKNHSINLSQETVDIYNEFIKSLILKNPVEV